jgi:predicted transcriptional regulator
MTLDRKDVNGSYEPDNCRWASDSEQANNARSNILVEMHGRVMTLAQAAREFSIPYPTLYSRVYHGQDPHEALLQLISKKK